MLKLIKDKLNSGMGKDVVWTFSLQITIMLCSFVITKEGKVTDAHVVKSSGTESLDNEALRVVNNMPDWKPGKENGEPVNVHYTIPVVFKLK